VSAIVIILAVIGLVLLILSAIGTLGTQEPAPPVEDIAAPYREGLHAAVRMQRIAQDLEQQIYAEAERHTSDEPGNRGT
jgi:hypothetical protein